jgi:hypothetical protein
MKSVSVHDACCLIDSVTSVHLALMNEIFYVRHGIRGPVIAVASSVDCRSQSMDKEI